MFKIAMNYFFEMRKNPWKSTHEIQQIRQDKLYSIIQYAYENVPYYKEKFRKAGITPNDFYNLDELVELPITTKSEILKSDLSYVSKEFNVKELYTSRTSGSTGEPFISYFDKRSWSILKYLTKYRARVACGFSFMDRFVIIEAISVEKVQNYNSKVNFFVKKKFLSVYDTFSNHVDFYLAYKPTTLYGFPSYFVNLISYLEKNSIQINFVKRIFTSSEVLNSSTRYTIENYFNCKVYDVYGSTETKEVSWECQSHEGYHINEDLFYLELLSENNMPVNNGDVGRIVITTLENKAMPLLRYFTGDLGIFLDKKCSCGRNFSLMKPVFGRVVDYFTLKNGTQVSPYELTMSIEDLNGIMQYQILQKTTSKVKVYLKVHKNFDERTIVQIIFNFKKILGEDMDIDVEIVEEIKKGEGEIKFRVIKSEVQNGI